MGRTARVRDTVRKRRDRAQEKERERERKSEKQMRGKVEGESFKDRQFEKGRAIRKGDIDRET